MFMRIKSNEHGYTMLETIMYMGILVALGGTIASYIAKGFARYKIGRTIQQIVDVKKTVVQYTASWEHYGNTDFKTDVPQTDLGNLCNQKLIADKALPIDISKSPDGKNLRHALGGKIYIGSFSNFGYTNGNNFVPCVSNISTNKYMFYVTFTGLKQEHCTEILTQGQFHGHGAELDALIVNIDKGASSQMRHFEHSFSKNALLDGCKPTPTVIGPNKAIKTTNFSVSEV